ncbi:MAG: hypothetical protein NZM43_05650 [Saprospiraceae bacterium]|nr:hypothetical protein [Saprospiraceae bacterium]MDW8483793.1 hypothetical protein [Saprospiraceae bacterium]
MADPSVAILSEGTPAIQLEPQRRRLTSLLLFILLYTILAGAVRKWILLGGPASNILLLGQLLLPWLFYLTAPGQRRRYFPILLIFGVLLLFMALNPLNHTLYHGIFGVLLHMGWWLMGFHYLENRSLYCWNRLYKLIGILLILETILSIIQYNLPRMHFINRYATEGPVSIAFVGEAARVTGTFSFVSGYAAWLLFINLWTWSVAVWKQNIWLLTGLTTIGVADSLLSGSRMSLVITLLLAVFAYANLVKRIPFHRVFAVLIIGLIVGAWAFRNSAFLQLSWSNFASRIQDGFRDEEYGRRTIGVLNEVINFKGDYALLGTGLGGTYQGARAIWGESYYLQKYGGYEEEPERIMLEGGYVLFLGRALLLWFFLRGLYMPLTAKVLFFVLITFFAPIVFNVYNLIFLALGLSAVDWSYRCRARSQHP